MTHAVPTPRMLYVHDDLSELLDACRDSSPARKLGHAFLARLGTEPSRIVVITVAQQIDALIARGDHAPFEMAVGIGRAGVRVAEQVHARTSWFPTVRRVDVWREEIDDETYVLGGEAALRGLTDELTDVARLAVVDDTIFSGFTVRAVLAAVPARARTRVFCLRGVADSIDKVSALAPVTAGIAAPGEILTGVSFVNASGFVRRGAIRRSGRPPLAFFERPEWMAAWFPDDHAEITALCRDLCAALSEV
jgi:pyrimidine operon attenuation protein/uracil phosphoribosyltransferase